MARLTLEQLEEKYESLYVYEKEAFAKGAKLVAGIDEAGRGPLAGPVVAAACILDPEVKILGLDDSKKLSEKKREELFVQIKEKALAYAVCEVDAQTIDEINILNATKKAMLTCVKELESNGHKPDVLLIDAVKLEGTDCEVIPIANHKGYGTKEHYAGIREKGMCPIHRRTFLKVIH